MTSRKGAFYVRMSTEHQKYSIANQIDELQVYATINNIEIVKCYEDLGKSGLTLEGRPGLKSLLHDVLSKEVNFTELLIYDISRWGRFTNADESAHHEYSLKNAGVSIHYCSESFINDGSVSSTIIKSVKRAMAAEYSSELSKKVFVGQERLIKLGCRQGGTPGFGLRRMLVDSNGSKKGFLESGEHKSIQTDRVILVPGPDKEIALVNRMYNDFVNNNKTETLIAQELNSEGVLTDLGKLWTKGTIHQILTNEKYIGNNVFNRTSFKLKTKRVKNDSSEWIRATGVFEAIVAPELFYMVKGIIVERSKRFSNEEMLEKLKQLFKKQGYLAGIIIDESDGMPASGAYSHRFGSLLRAYELVGFTPERDYSYIKVNQELRIKYRDIVSFIIKEIERLGGKVQVNNSNQLLTVNDEFTVSVVIAKHKKTQNKSSRWKIRFDASLEPDITIGIRMAVENKEIQDYYLLPHCEFSSAHLSLSDDNGIFLDTYRFDTLDYLFYLSERISIMEVA